jgi:TP901 family phage tail tape measure protein
MTIGKFVAQLSMDGSGYLTTLRNVGAELRRFQGTSQNATKSMVDFKAKMQAKGAFQMVGALKGMNWVIDMVMGKLKQLAVEAVKTNIAFEKSLSNLAAISGTTVEGIKELELEARRLGAATAYTAAEVVGLETELAKLGFTRQEILNSTEAVLKFALATGSDLAGAAKLAGATLRAFGADASEMKRYVSAMAIATTKSALSYEYLNVAMSTVAPVARQFGLRVEDVLAMLGVMADNGFEASTAATGLRNIILYLADANGKLAKAMGKPVNTFPEMIAGFRKLYEGGLDLSEALDLTDKRAVGTFATLLENTGKLEELQKALTGVEDELDTMADTMADNVKGSLDGLSSAWEGFTGQLKVFLPYAKDVIDALTWIVRSMTEEPTSTVIGKLAEDAVKAQKEVLKSTGAIEKYGKEVREAVMKAAQNKGVSEEKATQEVVGTEINNLREEIRLNRELLSLRNKEATAAADAIDARLPKGLDAVTPENWWKTWKGEREGMPNLGSLIPGLKSDALAGLEKDFNKATEGVVKLSAKLEENKQQLDVLQQLYPKLFGEGTEVAVTPELKDSEVKEEIARLRKELMTNPNLAVEVRVKYLNRIDELEKMTAEGRKKAYTLEQTTAAESKGLFTAATTAPKMETPAELKRLQGLEQEAAEARVKLNGSADDRMRKQNATYLHEVLENLKKARAAWDKLLEEKGNKPVNPLDVAKEYEQEEAETFGVSTDKGGTGEVRSIAFLEERKRKLQYEFEIVGTEEGRKKAEKELKAVEKELATLQPPSAMEVFGGFSGVEGEIDGMVGAFTRLQEALEGDASAWETFMAGFQALQSGVALVQSLVEVTEMLSAVTGAATAAKQAEGAAATAEAATEIATTTAVTGAKVAAETTEATAAVTGAATEVGAATAVTAAKETEAVAEAGAAAAGAASSQAGIPFVGPVLAIAAIAAILAALSGVVKFAEGGIMGGVVGGNSPSGDRLLARLNSGEMILNKPQQGNLYRALHGGAAGGGGISAGQQRRLFGEIRGFAAGGIAGAAGMNIPAVYLPGDTGTAVREGTQTPVGGAVKLVGDVEFKIRGEALTGVLKQREKRLSNA